jgi:hypothetical protein
MNLKIQKLENSEPENSKLESSEPESFWLKSSEHDNLEFENV